jgi:sn-glycerol 3-phosphate transport system substrate-binding protein
MLTSSTGAQANIRRNAKFEWSVNFIPYHDDVKGAPQNSIIGGASLWVMGGKTNNAYKGVAKFMAFLSRPEVQMDWHTSTGYVPITMAAYEMTRKSGFYDKNPGADVAIKQLTNKPPTGNSKGLRFGNFVQGREVIEEEMEGVFAGKKDAKAALDEAVKRGNEILRKFEAANKS